MSIAHRLVAHRGLPVRFPENTLAGAEAAIACGARFLEVDVQLTRDGVPVLVHDRRLERLCGRDLDLFELDLADIAGLDFNEPGRLGPDLTPAPVGRLADLATVVARHPELRLFVELKPESLEHFGREPMVAAAAAAVAACAGQVVFISFDLPALEVVRLMGGFPVGVVHHHWAFHRDPVLARLAPEYFFCSKAELPAAGALGLDGRLLAVYETVSPGEAADLLARGVDLVETFDFCAMAKRLGG